MRLLPACDVEVRPGAQVFAHSRTRALAGALAALAAAGALAWTAWARGFAPGWWLAGLTLFCLFVLRRFVLARFRASNWLARLDDEGIWLQLRSYLNHRLPADDLTVAFLPYAEIRAVRRVRERLETSDMDGGTVRRTLTWLELVLFVDSGPLAEALVAERRRRPRNGALYGDYPVRIDANGAVQVCWTVAPGVEAFLATAGRRLMLSAPAQTTADLSGLDRLDPDGQRRALAELVRSGDSIGAIRWACRLYGLGLAEAKAYVEALPV